jgi:hypothetical protein
MDAVAAVGLVASILQFIEVGTKVIKTTQEIRKSASGQTEDNRRMAAMIGEMRNLSATFADPKHVPQTSVPKFLRKRATDHRTSYTTLFEPAHALPHLLLADIRTTPPPSHAHLENWAGPFYSIVSLFAHKEFDYKAHLGFIHLQSELVKRSRVILLRTILVTTPEYLFRPPESTSRYSYLFK